MPIAIQRALISVSDKTGIEAFARALAERGVALLSTGGTHELLKKSGIQVTEVANFTGQPEMMGGRVKTLHPKIHGGILALRHDKEHQAAMQQYGVQPIDLVVVNLYPFEKTVADPAVAFEHGVEQIDIGGPSMVRSAAKNHRYVAVVTDPADYDVILKELSTSSLVSDATLQRLALKAFALTARYDTAIAGWLATRVGGDEKQGEAIAEPFAPTWSASGELALELRYGENPHQRAALYRSPDANGCTLTGGRVLGGKTLSYNNYVDLDAALALACEFTEPFAAVLKHNNPCGAASAPTLAEAIEQAWAGDPVSAFGSVLGFNRMVDLATAQFLTSDGRFVEAIVAPGFAPNALEHLTTVPKWGKNLRLVEVDQIGPKSAGRPSRRAVPISGGYLVQDVDLALDSTEECQVVTRSEPTAEQLQSLLFASAVCKHVKSNAIVIAKGTRVLGVGAGQMSRVDSVRLATSKAGDAVQGAVLASDAFFPFPDGPELAMEAGIVAFVQPGGSVKDKSVIEACDARGVAMVFTGRRHFRH